MASRVQRLGLILTLLASVSSPSFAQTPAVHPGGAYTATVPAGWQTIATSEILGYPYHLLSPDGATAAAAKQGIWLIAIPYPVDETLEAAELAVYVTHLLNRLDAGLKAAPGRGTPATIGTVKAIALAVEGKRNGAPFAGEVRVAARDDHVLIALAGGPPETVAALKTSAEAIYQTIVSGAIQPLRNEAPVLKDAQRARDVADTLAASVPLINILTKPGPDGQRRTYGTGSGFVISEDGYLMTNRHVVDRQVNDANGQVIRDTYDPVLLTWDQTTEIPPTPAEVVAVSHHFDVALLKIQGDRKWKPVPLCHPSKVKVGDKLLVVGWPEPDKFGKTTINQNEGTLTNIARDRRGRPTDMRHSARTTGGNSGGLVYDLELGGAVAVHYAAHVSKAKGFKEVFYHGAVPIQRVLWEFPQVTSKMSEASADRAALIQYYFDQERFGAAALECRRALEANPRDGMANAFLQRIYSLEMDKARAQECLVTALANPDSKTLAWKFAGRGALQSGDSDGARTWGTRLIAAAPNDPDGLMIRGHAEFVRGEFDAAAATFDQVAKLTGGRHAEAETMAGACLVQRWLSSQSVIVMPWRTAPPDDVVLEAKARLTTGLELQPFRNGRAHLYLGILAGLAKNPAEATKHREKIGSREQDSITLDHNVGGYDTHILLTTAYFDLLTGNATSAQELLAPVQYRVPAPTMLFLFGWSQFLFALELEADAKDAEKAGAAEKANQLKREAALTIRNSRTNLGKSLQLEPKSYWTSTALALLGRMGGTPVASGTPAATPGGTPGARSLDGPWKAASSDGKGNDIQVVMYFKPGGIVEIAVGDSKGQVTADKKGTYSFDGTTLITKDQGGVEEKSKLTWLSDDQFRLELATKQELTFHRVRQ